MKQEICPKCGTICTATETNVLDRAKQGLQKGQERLSKIGGKIGGLLGEKGRRAGSRIGALLGYTPIWQNVAYMEANVLANTLIGPEYKYVCPNCGYTWIDKDIPKEQLTNAINSYLEEANNFLSWPFEERKYLVIVDELTWVPNYVKALQASSLPNGIQFPNDEIQRGILYACHPYNQNFYIPLNSYEVEIFRDELDEYKHIMEYLGAKSISIHDAYTKNMDTKSNRSYNFHFGGNFSSKFTDQNGQTYSQGRSGNGDYNREKKDERSQKVYDEYGEERTYELTKDIKPCIPKNVVWYPHRKEWQKICNSRLEGRTLNVSKTFKRGIDNYISNSEKLKVAADIKVIESYGNAELAMALNSSLDITKSNEFTHYKERDIEVNVEFYPMSAYK